jgi:hypothetical protein
MRRGAGHFRREHLCFTCFALGQQRWFIFALDWRTQIISYKLINIEQDVAYTKVKEKEFNES